VQRCRPRAAQARPCRATAPPSPASGRSSVSMPVARGPGAPAPTPANSPRRIW
jgi:hypothetical protein